MMDHVDYYLCFMDTIGPPFFALLSISSLLTVSTLLLFQNNNNENNNKNNDKNNNNKNDTNTSSSSSSSLSSISFIRLLNDLSSRGKTRFVTSTTTTASSSLKSVNEKQQGGTTTTTTTTSSSSSSSSSRSSSSNKTIVNKRYCVPKSWFRFFYVIGVLNWFLFLYCIMIHMKKMNSNTTTTITTTTTTNEEKQQQDEQDQVVVISKLFITNYIIFYLYGIHVCRRLYENIFIHTFHPDGYMHMITWILGCFYYVFIPTIFITEQLKQSIHLVPCSDSIYSSNSSDDDGSNSSTTTIIKTISLENILFLFLVASSNILCQWEQYHHHVLLANLRRRTPTTTSTVQQEQQHERIKYKIPMGGMFEYVICPHYFFEILLYITFGILLYSIEIPTPQPPPGGLLVTTTNHLTSLFYEMGMYDYVYEHRYMVTMSFIICNLYYSAYETNQWYIRQFGLPYEQLHRKLLIPMIL